MGQEQQSSRGENLKNRIKKNCSQIKINMMDEDVNQNDANRLREDAGDGGDQGEAVNDGQGYTV